MKGCFEVHSVEETWELAKKLAKELKPGSVVCLEGDLGAGKTTFTTALCKALGVKEDAVSSPTFSIVNEYRTAGGEQLFHFDFYRIEHISEALDIGFYDYVDSGCLCIMEWPENIEEILPEETLRVSIDVASDGVRTLSWEA